MEKKIVHSFKRNDQEEIKVSVGTYKEKEYVDIRVFFRDAQTDEWRPTKKGITINRDLLGELSEGVKQAERSFASEC